MLREAEEELLELGKKHGIGTDKIRELQNQIEGLREEISNREDLTI